MFTVKAVYHGETRKLTFPVTFPTFDQLCEQLRRVFPLNNDFTISRLLFSPNSTKSIRLLIGQRVHSAEDYIRYTEPYRGRLWQDATLRLTVLDGSPGESPAATRNASYHWSQAAYSACNDMSSDSALPISMSCIPPPPIIFPSHSIPGTPKTQYASQIPGLMSSAKSTPCCSVESNKREVQTLLDNFMRDLNGLLTGMFPERDLPDSFPRNQQHLDDTHICTGCKRDTETIPFYCDQCGIDVCLACIITIACNKCPAIKTGDHRHHIVRRAKVPNRSSRDPKYSIRIPQASSTCPYRAPILSNAARPSARPTSRNTGSTPTQPTVRLSSCEGTRPSPSVVPQRHSDTGMHKDVVGHSAACDLCESGIRGARYKCLVCPDFDTCASCFSITKEQHPNHSFIKVSHPADYIRRAAPRPQHHAVCDVCNLLIFGTRYKCLHPDCPDFDLCERCEAHPMPQHPENHPLLKLKFADTMIPSVQTTQAAEATPIPAASEEATVQESPIHKVIEGQSVEVLGSEPDIPSSNDIGIVSPGQRAVSTSSPILHASSETLQPVDIMDHPNEIASILELSPNEKSKVKETEDEPLPIPPPVHDAMYSIGALLDKVLEEQQTGRSLNAMDITMPRGQTFPPGAEFIKTWRVTNNGLVEWPETTELVFMGGNAVTSDLNPILIGKVEIGAKVEISTRELKAPESPGHYVSCWMLRGHELLFGDRLWIDIHVTEPQSETSESLSSSSIMKMPHPASRENSRSTFDDKILPSDETRSDAGSSGTTGTMDNLSYDSDWQDCPMDPAGREEYVILYDDSSSEEN